MSKMRIKYVKQKDGTDKSTNLYSDKYKTYYYVVKDETAEIKTFRIINVNQKRTVYSHDKSLITNKAVLYRTIRDKLKELGVGLKTEIRPHQRIPSAEERKRGGLKNSRLAKERKASLRDGDSPKVTDE